jgi:hypothetical protein
MVYWSIKVIDRKGVVAYQLELPPQLLGIHDVFHVSQLKKCLRVPEEQLPLDELNVRDDLSFFEPIKILETSKRVAQNKKVKCAKSSGSIIQKKKQLGKGRVI